MERTKENALVLSLRIAQMVLGLAVMLFDVISAAQYNGNAFAVTGSFLGGGITLFGTLGLFAIKRHPNDIRDTRLYLLILYADCWAVAMCVAAGVCNAVPLSYGWGGWNYNGILFGPCFCAFACMLVVMTLVARTCRLWWRRDLHGMPPEDPVEKHYPSSYYATPSIRPQDNEAQKETATIGSKPNYEALICQAADEIRSLTSSRPFSLAETTNATLYPNAMSAGATVRSMPAPS